MTVSSDQNRKEYAGDGATTSFATNPVAFFDTSDLVVYVVDDATGTSTQLTENTDYSASGGGTPPATGTVDLSGGSSPYGAPASGETLIIVRDITVTQQTDLVNNDSNDAEVQEAIFDRLTMICQQLLASVNRRLGIGDDDSIGTFEIPNAVNRAGNYLAFDASGDPIASAGTVGTVVVSAFMETLLDDANAAAGRATLDVPATSDIATLYISTITPPTDADVTLSGLTYSSYILDLNDGSWASGHNIIVPDERRSYFVDNTAGTYDAIMKTSAGSGVTVAAGTSKIVFCNATDVIDAETIRAPITVEAEVATTSGTDIDISTGIPTWAKRVTIMLDGVSHVDGTSKLIYLVLGDSGGYETTGYVAAAETTGSTTDIPLCPAVPATALLYGQVILSLEDETNNVWTVSGVILSDTAGTYATYPVSGRKALTAALSQVKIATSASAFDAGAVSLSYE